MIHGPKPFSSDIFIFSYIGKRISPSTGIKSLLLLRAVVVTWGFEGVRTERKVRPSKVLQTRGVGECSTPLPPRKKKCKFRHSEILFPAFPEISAVHTGVCAYMDATLLRALASSNTICDCRSGTWALHYSSHVSSPWCFSSCKILVRVAAWVPRPCTDAFYSQAAIAWRCAQS